MGNRNPDFRFLIALLAQTFLLNVGIQSLQLSSYALPKSLILGANLVSISFYFMALLLIKKLLELRQQTRLLEHKETELNSLQSLLRTVRAQRHDIINHLDTVYTLLSLKKGLATVWEMVVHNGGTVEVKVKPVTFLVKLPRKA